ncbi:unnamed protein product [Citrullus colocynthis]|uniref:Uncharacterized protein n=1 Tax=Citrullus colocynthis TaxID=252529 RepID=A0ABP0Z7Q8_9ROSI
MKIKLTSINIFNGTCKHVMKAILLALGELRSNPYLVPEVILQISLPRDQGIMDLDKKEVSSIKSA